MRSVRRISHSSSRWTSRRAARRWTMWSGCTSNAYCARHSTASRARRGFWTSTAPRCTTSCGATGCAEIAVKPINLIPLSNGAGPMEPGLVVLEHLAATLARTFHTPCRIRPETFDVSFALDAGRQQYYSTSILQRLEGDSVLDARGLGVTAVSLYAPVLPFLFGAR